MKVESLDHVNIIASDLEATCSFYENIFELERRDAPPPLKKEHAQWMFDTAGRAIFHLNSTDCPRFYDRDVTPGPTGALHHVALRCDGFDEMQDRLTKAGREFESQHFKAAGLRQIFTQDPNGVLLELNFWAG